MVKMANNRELRDWLPYRSREEEPDDPDRQVHFDDLKPFLQSFKEPSSRFRLVANFLNFAGCSLVDLVGSIFIMAAAFNFFL